MANRRTWLIAAGVIAIAIASPFVYDALVLSEEEKLEVLVEDSTGQVDLARLDTAIGRWVDLSRQPFEVSGFGVSRSYGDGDLAELRSLARQQLGPLSGTRIRLITSAIEIEEHRATIRLRLMDDRHGLFNAEWSLRKHGDDWLVSRLSLRS